MLQVGDVTVSQPGDDDLDFDISDIRVMSWTEVEGSFVILMEGGCGWWIGEDGEPVDIMSSIHAEITATVHDEAIPWLAGALSRWDPETSLRLVMAPDRLAWLGRSPDDWVALPRTPFPV